MPRTPFIAGNWKLNKTVAEAEEYISALLPRVSDADGVDVLHAEGGGADLVPDGHGVCSVQVQAGGGKRKGKRGRGAAGKVPVFGILEREGRVFVEVLPTTRAKDVLALTVKKVRRGSIVYTDRYRSYDALMFCGYRHLRVDHGKYFSRGRVYINGLEGFWSYAKERIMKYHGVSPQRFPYYLKELEFRYNHRKTDLFPLITRCLCNLVPKRD